MLSAQVCSVLFLLLSVAVIIMLLVKVALAARGAAGGARPVWRTLLTHWLAVLLGIADVVAMAPISILCWQHVMLVGVAERCEADGEEHDDAGVSACEFPLCVQSCVRQGRLEERQARALHLPSLSARHHHPPEQAARHRAPSVLQCIMGCLLHTVALLGALPAPRGKHGMWERGWGEGWVENGERQGCQSMSG